MGPRGVEKYILALPIHAYRGIDHPTDREERKGYAFTKYGIGGRGPSGEIYVVDKESGEYGSPASDAQIKAYFKYGKLLSDKIRTAKPKKDDNGYLDNKGSEISQTAMDADPNLAKYKQRKDAIMKLQQHLGRRPLEAEIQKYLETGQLPEKGGTKSLYDPEELARREKERQAAMDRINRARNRNK